MKIHSSNLRAGDWVEVRTKEEIVRTLDENGQLDGMPFMPEMLAFCGKKFRVYKRAHKTCDTVFPVRGRRVNNAVHLDTRCDGSSHGGCQAGCLLFWKEAWLKPLHTPNNEPFHVISATDQPGKCSEEIVWRSCLVPDNIDGSPTYTCQATRLPYATTDLEWWDLGQYIEDYRSGNVGLWRMFCGGIYFLFLWLSNAGIGLGRLIRWSYDHFYPIWKGTPFPRRNGCIPEGQPTPTAALDLQPGELVRIKPYGEILRTLNTRNRNRGLYFDAEEVPYCGRTYRVLRRVERIINERTGKMRDMKGPCVILDSVVCESRYSECRLFCPRAIYPYWREIWLERVQEQQPTAASSGDQAELVPQQAASAS